MASVSLLIPSLPGANREAAEAWDALATHAGKQASVCRYGAELTDRTRRRWARTQCDSRRWCMNRNWPATILTQRLLTYRYRTTLARQGPSSD